MAQSSPETAATAELLAGYVHAAGVRHVFGYPAESTMPVRPVRPVRAVGQGQPASPFGWMVCRPSPTVTCPRTAQVAFPALLNSRG